ncbi:MAG: Gfo/Idh/MocA family oxidoreductase [Myxococcota bacterium]
MIGAGGIVREAHLPAYRSAGFEVGGVYDVRREASESLSRSLGGAPRVLDSLDEAFAREGVIFDVAVPGKEVVGILEHARPGSALLIQKPMGENLAEATRILALCREKRLSAAINFQLRFAPNLLALRDALARGFFGTLLDLEVRICLHTPWELWPFLRGLPRLELLYHSIHYLDAIRALVGEPRGVYCRGVRHPETPELADTRNTIVLDYGDTLRCSVTSNHAHRFGAKHACSTLALEGVRGAARLVMGVNLDYPKGEPDALELCAAGGEWRELPLVGSWFVDAFQGPMSNLQRFVAGEDERLETSVEDAIRSMALVEACYRSSASGGTPIP